MQHPTSRILAAFAAAVVVAPLGCDAPTDASPSPADDPASMTFSAWKETVRFPGYDDVYAVGETVSPLALVGEDEARAYFETHVMGKDSLILHSGQTLPGDPRVGSYFPERAILTFCIDRVGLRDVVARHSYLRAGTDLYPLVEYSFKSAAAAWSVATGITFVHVADRDDSCRPLPGDTLTWYVTPLFQDPNAPIEYFSFAVRPHQNALGPDYRNFYVWEDIITEFTFADPTPFGDLFTLEGLMLHTLGHALGFVPESNRGGVDTGIWPSTCRQPDVGGIFLSVPDPYSVMTHPQAMTVGFLAQPECAGARQFDYALSPVDVMGAACQYRGEHGLYYCNAGAQELVRSIPPDPNCSPLPLVEGPADCGEFNWDGHAASFEAALISAMH